jgi:signal transduction histidine kinase
MAAQFTDLRSEDRRRRATERLVLDWAARTDAGDLERFAQDADFIEETAILGANNDLHRGKGARQGDGRELHGEIQALRRRIDPARPAPVRDGARLLIPVVVEGRVSEVRFLRFREGAGLLEGELRSMQTVYLILVLGAAASMGVTALALRAWVLAPLDELARGAERVARGDYSTPVPVRHEARDEIAAVAAAFNAMTAEIGTYRRDLEAQVGSAVRKARSAEKTLITAQRLAAMGTLAAGIAHDINNPLGGMINAVRALRRDDLPPAKREEYLALIEEGLERVGQTVQKVLQFTPHRVSPGPCDLGDVARRALALAHHRIERSGAKAAVELPEGGLPVFGDPYELQQVVLNLLVNAADAVAAKGAGGGRVSVRGEVRGPEVRLRVEDDGVGMSEEQVARAFDLFYTTKEVGEGTGLGLSMVHSIVENHGGRVELRSRKGEGTAAEVVLPRHG